MTIDDITSLVRELAAQSPAGVDVRLLDSGWVELTDTEGFWQRIQPISRDQVIVDWEDLASEMTTEQGRGLGGSRLLVQSRDGRREVTGRSW